MKTIFRITSLILGLFFWINTHAAALPESVGGQPLPSLSSILKGTLPSIVNVSAQGEITPPDNPFNEPSDNARPSKGPRRFESMASGVIIDAKNGYVLTNAHVLRDIKSVSITLSDGRVFKAKVIGIDAPSDIAVVQIPADKLTEAKLGNSDNLKVGDFVAAIGNPFGLNQTVTSGIVSGLGRTGLGIEGYENFIQTDASINPGNSGGALINLKGQVIGINTAILAPAGGNIGIGFAIPINMAHSVMMQLVKYGSVKRGLMGIYVQDLTPELATAFHIPDQSGALVSQIYPSSPAAAAGIRIGDIIQTVDDQKILNASQVRNIVGMLRVGAEVSLGGLRNGKPISFTLTTADPDQYMESFEHKNRYLGGLSLESFHQQIPSLGFVSGVQVLTITENSPGFVAGLRPGDVILSANQTPVSQIEDLQKIADASKDGLLLNVLVRGGGASFVLIK